MKHFEYLFLDIKYIFPVSFYLYNEVFYLCIGIQRNVIKTLKRKTNALFS